MIKVHVEVVDTTVAVVIPLIILLTVRMQTGYHHVSAFQKSPHHGDNSSKTALQQMVPPNNKISLSYSSDIDPSRKIGRGKQSFQSPIEIIELARSSHIAAFREVLGKRRKIFLFDLADIENKGDPAISVGELNLLGELNVSLEYACSYSCSGKQLDEARQLAESMAPSEVAVFFSGGGNFGGYPQRDMLRAKILKQFAGFRAVLFPQSTWFHNDGHLKWTQSEYSKHPDFHIFLRDTVSRDFTKLNFPAVKSQLLQDMAFHIGPVPRFFPPLYDIIWLARTDGEKVPLEAPEFPAGLHVFKGDYYKWPTPKGRNLIELSHLITYNGLLFLQRGKVLITERLHGHILAILSDIPTVIIDNKIKKVSSYRNNWTNGLENVLVATDSQDAVRKALSLLKKHY